MKIGELFVNLGVKGNTDALNKTIKQLETAKEKLKDNKRASEETAKKYDTLRKYLTDLKNASSESEKQLIKKSFAQKVSASNTAKEITAADKQISQQKKLKGNINESLMSFRSAVNGITAFAKAVIVTYNAIDKMITSLSIANQGMINFQRQTGISFSSLNKYASAAASVNYNATPEQTADTMQRLAQNLYDIRMGRGDISPYQELSFVGGKSFTPFGMDVETLIENVREAIKGVGDVQATDIITRMGFNPDDLLMLRMTREEMEKFNDLFLTGGEREKMNAYALQIKRSRLEMQLLKDRALLAIMPGFVKLTKNIADFTNFLVKCAKGLKDIISGSELAQDSLKALGLVLAGLLIWFQPVIAAFAALYLILEDLAVWNAGGDSVFGRIFGDKGTEKFKNSWIYKFAEIVKDIAAGLDDIYTKSKDILGLGITKLSDTIKKNIYKGRFKKSTGMEAPETDSSESLDEYVKKCREYYNKQKEHTPPKEQPQSEIEYTGDGRPLYPMQPQPKEQPQKPSKSQKPQPDFEGNNNITDVLNKLTSQFNNVFQNNNTKDVQPSVLQNKEAVHPAGARIINNNSYTFNQNNNMNVKTSQDAGGFIADYNNNVTEKMAAIAAQVAPAGI